VLLLPTQTAIEDDVDFFSAVPQSLQARAYLQLLKLAEEDLPRNKKTNAPVRIFKKYTTLSYAMQEEKAKLKVSEVWKGLSRAVKDRVLLAAGATTPGAATPPDKASGATIVPVAVAAGLPTAPQRAPNTTADDRARVLHLRFDCPDALRFWARAFGVKDRQTLDADQSKKSEEDVVDANPWEALAAIYNATGVHAVDWAPENLSYHTPPSWVVVTEAPDPVKALTPMPNVSRYLLEQVWELDPNRARGPNRAVRNATWLKAQWQQLRASLTTIWSNFCTSGKHGGDIQSQQGRDEWSEQYCFGDRVLAYAALLVDKQCMEQLGKEIGEAQGGFKSFLLDKSGRQVKPSPAAVSNRSRTPSSARRNDDQQGVVEQSASEITGGEYDMRSVTAQKKALQRQRRKERLQEQAKEERTTAAAQRSADLALLLQYGSNASRADAENIIREALGLPKLGTGGHLRSGRSGIYSSEDSENEY
jgi:hypothetical protein